MSKTWQIAWREFLATVMTKGFLIGMLVLPLMMGLMVLLIPWFINMQKAPNVEGSVVIIDDSGLVAAGLRDYLSPEAFAARRLDMKQKVDQALPAAVRGMTAGHAQAGSMIEQQLAQALGEVPQLRFETLPAGSDIDAQKSRLKADNDEGRPLAVLHIAADSVWPADGAARDALGSYELLTRKRVDDRLIDALQDGARAAIVAARMDARDLDAGEMRALSRVARPDIQRVDASGETAVNEITRQLMPMAFLMLIFISVMTAGQYLMTSTIEEKSSRVVEVLLAAVSPMQLMGGKILGQLMVGSVTLAVYAGLGLLALATLASAGFLEPMLLVWLLVYFLIAFVTMAALMAAIGAAVNELREAQALLTPVMLTMVLPMMLWQPISRDPNGTLATVASLIPPVSPFVMILRLSSSVPPPAWQIAASIAIGVAAVFATVWMAGKVFRVGLLMHGKPPSFATLIRWIRMA